MTRLDEYSTRYSSVRMRREEGILEMQFHTNGGPLRWSKLAHGDLEGAFLDAGRDRDNEVIIITMCCGRSCLSPDFSVACRG